MHFFKIGGLFFLTSFFMIHSMQNVKPQAPAPLTALEKEFLRAAQINDLETLKRGLADGINVNVKDSQDESALNNAFQWHNFESAEFLAQQKNIDPNIISKNAIGGRTPLHLACSQHHFNTCIKSRYGITEKQRLLLIALLLEAGADPNAQDCHFRSPLHLALELPFAQAIRLLIDAGASPHCPNANQKPLLQDADEMHKIDHLHALLVSPKITTDNLQNALKNNKEKRQEILNALTQNISYTLSHYKFPHREWHSPLLRFTKISIDSFISHETFKSLNEPLFLMRLNLDEQGFRCHKENIYEPLSALKKYQKSYKILFAYYRTQKLVEEHKKKCRLEKNKSVPKIFSLPPELVKLIAGYAIPSQKEDDNSFSLCAP